MALDMGDGNVTARTRQLVDKWDYHQKMDGHLEGEDTMPLLGRIEALERAMRAGHSAATHDTPSVANSGHGRQLIMT